MVAKERYPNEVVVNDHGLFKMIQSEDKIEVVSLLTNKTIVTYHKHVGLWILRCLWSLRMKFYDSMSPEAPHLQEYIVD